MFEDSGGKLKLIAKVFFIINLIGFVILAFMFGWSKEHNKYGGMEKEFQPVVFCSIIIAGPLVSYIECLSLYALGETVDNSLAAKNNTQKYKEFIATAQKEQNKNPSPSIVDGTTRSVSWNDNKSSTVMNEKLFKTCPKCGEENGNRETYCRNCGARL